MLDEFEELHFGAWSADLSKFYKSILSEQIGGEPVMDSRAIVQRCIYENWPNDVSMIGKDLTARIVDDTLQERRTEFLAPTGGSNFDLISHIDTIIAAAGLSVSILQLVVMLYQLGDTRDRSLEERVKILEQAIIKARGAEAEKNIGLICSIIRSIIRGIDND